ncbi:hypothetical protein [Nonomuraea dietziae]|uniref:hypothetical protein n=1 Tax=Nonomuraea dietziae TaxID=65515 RepID=UPI003439C22F
MMLLLLALLIAGVTTTAIYRNPTARAAATGAWGAASAQARVEVEHGWAACRTRYGAAQDYLGRPVQHADGSLTAPSPLQLRWWASGLLGVTAGTATAAAGALYGLGCAMFAGGRTIKAATAGAQAAVRQHRQAQIVEAEVVDDPPAPTPVPAAAPGPAPARPGPVRVSTPAVPTPRTATTITEDPMAEQMINGAGDKLSHGQLKDALGRVSKHLASGASELDVIIAGLRADEVDEQTVAGLRELQELLSTASSKASAVRTHVTKTDSVAEAINAVGAQNVAKTQHYAAQ